MSLIGEGTKSSPYIVRNYEDFNDALMIQNFPEKIDEYNYTKYIEFDKYKRDSEGNILKDEQGNDILLTQEEKTIDFNDIECEDLNGWQINLCNGRKKYNTTPYDHTTIYGNDWILKNIWSYYDTIFINNSSSNQINIYKLHFLNLFQSFIGESNVFGTAKINFIDCKFSMLLASSVSSYIAGVNHTSNVDHDIYKNFYRCSLNIRSISPDFSIESLKDTRYKLGNIQNYINTNFRLNIYNTTGIFNDQRSDTYAHNIKYCKFSGIIHNGNFFKKTNFSFKNTINNLYQLKLGGQTNVGDAISGMINSNYSTTNQFNTVNDTNIHFAPINKTGDSDEYLLNIDYLIRNNFPVMSEDEEDDNLI